MGMFGVHTAAASTHRNTILSRRAAMESRTKVFGHPIHPMLIVFPVGLLVMAVIFDILRYLTGDQLFSTAAYYDIAAGIVGGLLAAIFGFTDWLAIPGGTRAKTVGLWHGIGNVTLVVLFAISWLIRDASPRHQPDSVAFILALAGLVLGLVTSWLGGELVYRLRMAVDDGANLNAPSSLSGKPAGTPANRRR
jgi:uncharacterized membrane protein